MIHSVNTGLQLLDAMADQAERPLLFAGHGARSGGVLVRKETRGRVEASSPWRRRASVAML
jgi:hypothetical protein